jgi:hypothetical protein
MLVTLTQLSRFLHEFIRLSLSPPVTNLSGEYRWMLSGG